jgi:cyclophilin family peptidyl-prolyl cis-trans isomerase
MRSLTRSTLVLGVVFSMVAVSLSQETAPAAAPGPKRAEFEKLFVEWRAIVGEMRGLLGEYEEAKPARQKEIRTRYDELTEQGEVRLEPLIGAAIEANKEAPGKDTEITQFLLGILSWQVGSDYYEKAYPLAKTLIDGGFTHPSMYSTAGQAAFGIGEFDAAGEYFKIASEHSELSDEQRLYFASIPYYKEAWPKEQKIRAEEEKADNLPRVRITTEHGEIDVELFENEAPNTVANFISLVEKGFYDGLTFHRVLPMFMAQGGCPHGTGEGGPGYGIPCECYSENHRLHFRGSLSMAHSGRDTGGSQFFINFIPTRQLDGRHTAFGRVIKGFDVMSRIRRRNPEDPNHPNTNNPEKIVKMEVIRKRDHDYVPKKVGE